MCCAVGLLLLWNTDSTIDVQGGMDVMLVDG
jgi:hypothetical protein